MVDVTTFFFSKNSHACEESGDFVQKICSTKQIGVQSHGSCFILAFG